jgi:hypothetical protein
MKSRRGLSTVIGAVFFVIAATTVITYISYSMNAIDEFAQSVIVSEAENINRGMEGILISQVTIVGGEFNVSVINTGSLSVQITRLWVVNEDTGLNSKVDLNERINPGNQIHNIGQNTGISANSATSYTLKVVTSRGNISTFSVSPNISTQVQILIPGEVQPGENFRIVTFITNKSTEPNNIVDLVPIIKNNSTLTQIDGPLPPSIASLPQGNTATFISTYVAPDLPTTILFNATYTGAPSNALVNSNMIVALSAEAGTNSQWSQAVSRVGILISGLPNPISSSGNSTHDGMGNWGIGIINPLNRPVDVYSVGILSTTTDVFKDELDIEPTTGWREVILESQDMIVWEGGSAPVQIGAKDIGQFRVKTEFDSTGGNIEAQMAIQALTSEGKLSAIYPVSMSATYPSINVFYTNSTDIPPTDWTYLINNIPSSKVNQLFNATVQNASMNILASGVTLIILIPSDFTNVTPIGGTGWDAGTKVMNDDGSSAITASTTLSTFAGKTYKTYQFSANAPNVIEDKLYVFQTTTLYPTFNGTGNVQLASALSEAGVEVVP